MPTVTEDEARAAVQAAAALFAVPLRPAWHEAATASFLTVAAAAALLEACPLDDEADYAPVFRA